MRVRHVDDKVLHVSLSLAVQLKLGVNNAFKVGGRHKFIVVIAFFMENETANLLMLVKLSSFSHLTSSDELNYTAPNGVAG